MPVEFNNLRSSANTELVHPREIFASLVRPSDFSFLRDVQGQVLDQWFSRRQEADLSIKMNTGTGKTIVGLLILQSSMNEGIGPSLYVAPDKYLANQVADQAEALTIPVVRDYGDEAFLGGNAICVTNIYALFNGRSVFGGPGSTRDLRIPLGSVVIDDAHAALFTVEEQATLTFGSTHDAYKRLLALFDDDLKTQGNRRHFEIVDGDRAAILRVPFWSWADRSREVLAILREYQSEDDAGFALPFIADLLPVTQAVISGTELQIRPPLPPVQLVRSFSTAPRRVYLTATLADDGVLVSHFNASAESISMPITPPSASDMGDRLILAPQSINPSISAGEIQRLAEELSVLHNVVVLVPSSRRASAWAEIATEIAYAGDLEDVVDRLRNGHVGLVVLVNKYDGIDLPNDACRLLVLDGVPQAYGVIDRRVAQTLGTSAAMTTRQLQRIEQGIGRGVRGSDDYCAILLSDPRVASMVALAGRSGGFGPATTSQMDLSNRVAEQLRDQPIQAFRQTIDSVLARDHDWIAVSRQALAATRYGEGQVSQIVTLQREAFNYAVAGNWAEAVASMEAAANAAVDDEQMGLLKEQVATYKHQIDSVSAQAIQASAKSLNPSVLKPLAGVAYRRLSASTTQAHALTDFLASTYSQPSEFVIAWNAISADLAFDPDRVKSFEEAVMQLGLHLGFDAHRPDRDTGEGPDVLWMCSDQPSFVIECKSGKTSGQITRNELSQLDNSLRWFRQEYPNVECHPILIHPSETLSGGAIPTPGTRVLTEQSLGQLAEACGDLLTALASSRGPMEHSVVENQFQHRQLTTRQILEQFATQPTTDQ